MQGESLLSFMKLDQASAASQPNDSNLQRSVYAESAYGHLSFGWSTLRAWRTEKYLYIEAPERELYDQSADPLAAHNWLRIPRLSHTPPQPRSWNSTGRQKEPRQKEQS